MFPKCECGNFTFAGPNKDRGHCGLRKCTKPRPPKPKVYYYIPISGRLRKLLKSEVFRKFFEYERHRHVEENIITDVYDGQNWKNFKNLINVGENLIGLEVSWDGTNLWEKNSDSVWPIFCSILNFPPTLRNKLHCGSFLLGITDKDYCIWDAIVNEMLDLWVNGIVVQGIKYRVAIVRVVLDGRGMETLLKVQGK